MTSQTSLAIGHLAAKIMFLARELELIEPKVNGNKRAQGGYDRRPSR